MNRSHTIFVAATPTKDKFFHSALSRRRWQKKDCWCSRERFAWCTATGLRDEVSAVRTRVDLGFNFASVPRLEQPHQKTNSQNLQENSVCMMVDDSSRSGQRVGVRGCANCRWWPLCPPTPPPPLPAQLTAPVQPSLQFPPVGGEAAQKYLSRH